MNLISLMAQAGILNIMIKPLDNSKMCKKFAISVEEIRRRYDSLLEIEKYKLKDIQFFEKGKPLEINPKDIEEHNLCGLLNRHFILDDYYKGEVQDE